MFDFQPPLPGLPGYVWLQLVGEEIQLVLDEGARGHGRSYRVLPIKTHRNQLQLSIHRSTTTNHRSVKQNINHLKGHGADLLFSLNVEQWLGSQLGF